MKPKKTKIVLIVLVILALYTGFAAYFLIYVRSQESPLDYGWLRTVGVGAGVKANEVSSAGFSLYNTGAARIVIEKVEVRFTDDIIELVDLVFVKVEEHQGTSTLRGTPEENGYVTYPVEGYVIEPKKEAQLYVSVKAGAVGNHSVTRIIFTYTYEGWTHQFTYNIEDHYILKVSNA